jgi:hypothetical protein
VRSRQEGGGAHLHTLWHGGCGLPQLSSLLLQLCQHERLGGCTWLLQRQKLGPERLGHACKAVVGVQALANALQGAECPAGSAQCGAGRNRRQVALQMYSTTSGAVAIASLASTMGDWELAHGGWHTANFWHWGDSHGGLG